METKEAYQVRRDTSSALVEQVSAVYNAPGGALFYCLKRGKKTNRFSLFFKLRGEKNELLVMRGEVRQIRCTIIMRY